MIAECAENGTFFLLITVVHFYFEDSVLVWW